MTTIELGENIKVDFSDLIAGVSKMETKELERFLNQMSLVLARKKNPLSAKEVELLDFVYQKFPEKEQAYYDELQVKLKQGILTSKEHQDLLHLVEKTELHNVKWLEAMMELAEFRAISLSTLMLQLGFKDRQKLLV